MPKTKKNKMVVRVCSVCQKPGHNKARCPLAQNNTKQIPNNSVAFIIHDNQNQPTASPHIVNLQKGNIWQNIKTSKPEENSSLFYSYHNALKEHALTINDKKVNNKKPEINFFKAEKEKLMFKLFPSKPKVFSETNNLDLKEPANNRQTSEEKIEITEIDEPDNTQPLKIKKRKVKKIKSKKDFFAWPQINFSIKRALAGATLVAITIVTPLKAGGYYQEIKSTTSNVAENGIQGFMALQNSTAALLQSDIDGAGVATEQALNNFNSAVKQLEEKHQILQKIASVIPVVSGEVTGRQKILTAGQKITLGNTYILKGIIKSRENNDENLTKKINTIVAHLNAAIPNYESALEDLDKVKADILPLEYQAPFIEFKDLFKVAVNDLKTISELGKNLSQIFGDDGLRRYLLVFQNPYEIRPTGGFIGSFAVIDVNNGKIEKIDLPAGGSYDLKGQLDKWVEPPTPLLLANSRWEFQDANWFPDFSVTAEKLMWFYRHSRNRTVDGVISINSTVLERILSIMGPLEDSERGLVLTSENAVDTIQDVVENGEEKQTNKPKQILADLAPKFLDFLQNIKPEQAMPILTSLSDALENKEIQAYFSDKEVESNMKKMNWSGTVKTTKLGQDYLMVINTNIQGQKSDALIKQTIEHQSIINERGEIVNTVVVTREHTGEKSDDLYNQTNVDYLRIYVPKNSKLISVNGAFWPHEKNFKAPASWTEKDEFLANTEKEIGFEPESGTRITEEFDKTAFGNWMITEPGTVSQMVFTYKLPFVIFSEEAKEKQAAVMQKIFDTDYLISDYQLVVQKQSGVDSKFESQIIYPEDWHPTWENGPDANLAANGMSISTELEKDLSWGLIMRKILN